MRNDASGYLDAAADLLGLPIAPADRDEAVAAMDMLLAQARLVLEFPIEGDIEPAPRFTPC